MFCYSTSISISRIFILIHVLPIVNTWFLNDSFISFFFLLCLMFLIRILNFFKMCSTLIKIKFISKSFNHYFNSNLVNDYSATCLIIIFLSFCFDFFFSVYVKYVWSLWRNLCRGPSETIQQHNTYNKERLIYVCMCVMNFTMSVHAPIHSHLPSYWNLIIF